MKITAPTSAILAGGPLREWALDLISGYSQIERKRLNGHTEYSNVPSTITITMAQLQDVVALGGEIEGMPSWIKVTDLSAELPDGPHSDFVDKEGTHRKTYQDLETATWKWTLANDGSYFIDVEALAGKLKASEILECGLPVLTRTELEPYLVTNETL